MELKMNYRSTLLSLCFGLTLGDAAAAHAQIDLAPAPPAPAARIVRLEGRALHVDTPEGPRTIALPCEGRALHVLANRAYVACGQSGVLVLTLGDQGARVERLVAVQGEATGFFSVGERVWVTTTRTMAEPVDQLAPSAPMALAAPSPTAEPSSGEPQPPPPPPPPSGVRQGRVGRVLRVEADVVVVDLGSEDGLLPGSHVALQDAADDANADEELGDAPLAIGEVIAVSESRARVRLGFSEAAPVGARARRVDAALSRSRVAPPRVAGLSIDFIVRPMLSLADDGFVAEMDAGIQYRGERRYFLRAELSPLAGAVG
jgi:hypothetical protein